MLWWVSRLLKGEPEGSSQEWSLAAESLGLEVAPATSFDPPVITGKIVDHLARLARGTRGTPAAVRASAFEHLAAHMPAKEAGAFLEEGLRSAVLEVRLAAVASIRGLRRLDCTEQLATLAARRTLDEEEQSAILEAIVELGGEHAEPTLISLLSAQTSGVRLGAATALARHGTIAAARPASSRWPRKSREPRVR